MGQNEKNCTVEASRPPFFDEKDTADQIEILRRMVIAERQVMDVLAKKLDAFVMHQHGPQGEILVPIKRGAESLFEPDRIPYQLRTLRTSKD